MNEDQIRRSWLADIDKIADAIAVHIPNKDISLIIEDYLATPIPGTSRYRICHHCNAKHHRTVENICMDCRDICLVCKKHATFGEKQPLCLGCIHKYPHTMNAATSNSHNKSKSQLYYEWNCCKRFPSQMHHQWIGIKKQEDARIVEKKRLEDEFLNRENAKPPAQQIAELRAKLYEANKHANLYRFCTNGKAAPEFPYF